MSLQTVVLNNGNQAIINTDTSKVFVWGKETQKETYTNSTGSEVTLTAGTLMGRISGTGLIVPLTSAAVDGSQYPIGIIIEDVVVPDTESRTVDLGVAGHVVRDKVVYQGADVETTVVDGKQLRDRIMSDTKGILLVESGEQSATDNQ